MNRKLVLDVPSRQPALGFPELARGLSSLVMSSEPRFAVGIFGGWGSGKTTLMEAIRAGVDSNAVLPVWFNAWRYEKEEHLIVPLLDVLRASLLDWKQASPATRETAKRVATVVGRAIVSLLNGFSLKVGLPGAVEASFEANKALDGVGLGEEATPRSFYHATFEALRKVFEEFVEEDSTRRIVVFVDDLDRCLPEKALEVLEAMKLFFDLAGFVFVVGLDRKIIETCIDAKYAVRRERKDAEAEPVAPQLRGADYVRKIFQVPYNLAPVAPERMGELLQSILDDGNLPAEQRAELQNVVQPHLRFLVEEEAVNPREVKRYINAYTIQMTTRGGLNADVVLGLQTIAFRRDWGTIQAALLAYRSVFIEALRNAFSSDPGLLACLRLSEGEIPPSFRQYTTGPGAALLGAPNLDDYLVIGESTRSTAPAEVADALSKVGLAALAIRRAGEAPIEKQQIAQILEDVNNARGKLEHLISLPLVDSSVNGLAAVVEVLGRSDRTGSLEGSDKSRTLELLDASLASLLAAYRATDQLTPS